MKYLNKKQLEKNFYMKKLCVLLNFIDYIVIVQKIHPSSFTPKWLDAILNQETKKDTEFLAQDLRIKNAKS